MLHCITIVSAHSGYDDTGSSTTYKTYLEEMKNHYTFDIITTIINSGSAGTARDATLQSIGTTHT